MIELLQRRTGWWQGRAEPTLPRVPELRVGRLRMVAITPAMLAAEHACDAPELMRLLGAQLTAEWPPTEWEPHVYTMIAKQYEEWPQTFGWHRYVLLTDSLGRRTLIGAVGGFPKPNGDVEIGYSTLPAFQRQSHGSAFARKLVEWLLSREGVQSVSAQTYPSLPESIKVMERCGMTYTGPGDDPGTLRYRRMR